MKLYEFAPHGGGDKGNFYSSTLDFANNWEDHVKDWETDYAPEVAQEEAQELLQVANAFLRGLKTGAEAFYNLDTLIRDELSEHWEADGLDPRVIYNIKLKLPKGAPRYTLVAGFDNWKSAILKKYPGATFAKMLDTNINAMDGNIRIGQWVDDLDSGTVDSQ